MKVKMGGLLASNLERALQTSPPHLARKIRVGRALLRGGGAALNAADSLMGKAVGTGLAPGGSGAKLTGDALGAAYNEMRKHPRALMALGVGLPTGLYLSDQAQKSVVPLLDDAIEEGRTVYANDKAFLEKKASQSKTEKVAVNWDALVQGIGKGVAGGGKGVLEGIEHLGQSRGLAAAMGPHTAETASQIAHNTALGKGMLLGGGGALAGAGLLGLTKGLGKDTTDTKSYQVNRALNPLTDRVRADELMAKSFFSSLGSDMAAGLTGLLTDMASKAMGAMHSGEAGDAMVEAMMASDPILRRGDKDSILDAYHSMAKFAPTLAADENAVRSFLRESVMAGNGPDYASIANLARAERDVVTAKNPLKK